MQVLVDKSLQANILKTVTETVKHVVLVYDCYINHTQVNTFTQFLCIFLSTPKFWRDTASSTYYLITTYYSSSYYSSTSGGLWLLGIVGVT